VLYLDCQDEQSALSSMATALGADASAIANALQNYSDEDGNNAVEDPWRRMPRMVLERFRGSVENVATAFEGAYYFHGTRTRNVDAYRARGILPLHEVVDEIWAELQVLAGDSILDDDWELFRSSVEGGGGGHDGWLYRLKVKTPGLRGPFGVLVRDSLIAVGDTRSHDYLGCPETVQDIARCYAAKYGVDLEARRKVDGCRCC
jgi:hypothetical protein